MDKWRESSLKTKQGLMGISESEKKMNVINAFQEKKNVKEEINHFFDETSFTALQRIYKAESFVRRVAWTVVVVAMMSWLGVQCYWLLDRYFKYPMEVKLDLKAAPELDFPSVTICNLNPILQSEIDHDPYTELMKYAEPETSDLLFTATLHGWMFNESCNSDQYSCSNGRCIPAGYVCDGVNDCNNNDDEEHCADFACPGHTFKCKNNVCVSIIARCNGNADCSGGEDELNCTGTATCPAGYFACTSGLQCTYSHYKCDGYKDCRDSSDEPADCAANNSSSTTPGYGSGSGSVTSSGTGSGTTSGTGTDPATLSSLVGSTDLSTTETPPVTDVTANAPQAGRRRRSPDPHISTNTPHAGRRRRDINDHPREASYRIEHSKKKYRHHRQQTDKISAIKKRLQSELNFHRGPFNKKQMVQMLQENFVEYMKKKRASKKNMQMGFSGNKPISRRHRFRRSQSRSSESSEDRSDIQIDWKAILNNSTFNKWDALSNNGTGTDSYYGQRDDEWEATMTYAYITATLADDVVERSGILKKNFIASCEFNGYQCSPSNFTFFHSHKYGNCYTFNSMFSGAPKLTTRFQGPGNGLTMELFINQREYVANLATEAGARVLIHKRGSMPFPEDNGITMLPGRSTSIGIKQKIFSRLPPPHGVCAKKGDVVDYYNQHMGYEYSKLSCLKSCYQNTIMEFCGCAVPFYYVPTDKTVCDMLNNATERCVTELPNVRPERYKECDKKCPQPCEETDYDFSISSGRWPSEHFESFLHQKLTQTNYLYASSEVEDDFTKIQIYYQDLIYTHIEQQKGYESMNLISDLGGQLGLWLGLSAITIGELCSLLFSVGRKLPSTWFGGAKTSPSDTAPAATISPATLEDMYDDLCPEQAKYIPPDIIRTKSDLANVRNSDE